MQKINKLERLWTTINKDKNKVYLPNGVWADWSRYGKNVDDAIDYYNDFKFVERLNFGTGAVVGLAVAGVAAIVVHCVKKKKKQEETEEIEEEA